MVSPYNIQSVGNAIELIKHFLRNTNFNSKFTLKLSGTLDVKKKMFFPKIFFFIIYRFYPQANQNKKIFFRSTLLYIFWNQFHYKETKLKIFHTLLKCSKKKWKVQSFLFAFSRLLLLGCWNSYIGNNSTINSLKLTLHNVTCYFAFKAIKKKTKKIRLMSF